MAVTPAGPATRTWAVTTWPAESAANGSARPVPTRVAEPVVMPDAGPVATLPARIRLAELPTPLAEAPQLAVALGTGPLLIKRDDLTGFAFGGNKARPLEFLLPAAIAEGADTLMTGGAPGSNFCAAAAAAANRAGLGCELLIAGRPALPGPALALALSWGATVRWTGSADRRSVDDGLPRAAAELMSQGHRPYVIPRGGATALGAAGFALAAFELRAQCAERGIETARVVVPAGSGGTMAGLVAGNVLLGRPFTLLGASASRPPDIIAARVLDLARGCVRLLGADGGGPGGATVAEADVAVADVRGPGHGLPSSAGTAAAALAMREAGLIADPVYTAKALALLPRCAAGETVVFWHTGGILDAVAAAMEDRR